MKKTGLCPCSRADSLWIQSSLIPFICFLLNSVCFSVVVGADSGSCLPPNTQPSATGHPADRGGASPHCPANWTHPAPPERRVWPRKRWLRKKNQRVSKKHGCQSGLVILWMEMNKLAKNISFNQILLKRQLIKCLFYPYTYFQAYTVNLRWAVSLFSCADASFVWWTLFTETPSGSCPACTSTTWTV